jgi:hypothetical protein
MKKGEDEERMKKGEDERMKKGEDERMKKGEDERMKKGEDEGGLYFWARHWRRKEEGTQLQFRLRSPHSYHPEIGRLSNTLSHGMEQIGFGRY